MFDLLGHNMPSPATKASRSLPQGKRSATFFWPGSDADIGGQHPTYWMPYNDDTLFSERVQQVGRRSLSSLFFTYIAIRTRKLHT